MFKNLDASKEPLDVSSAPTVLKLPVDALSSPRGKETLSVQKALKDVLVLYGQPCGASASTSTLPL